jgi:predicted dehydrogenase
MDDPTMARRRATKAVVHAAIVGAGRMGRWHARAVEAAGGAVVAVVDSRLDRAHALANGVAAAPALAELRPELGLDVVHVCTPVGSHAEIVAAAVDAGAHAIVEKPLAEDAPATRELLERTVAAGRLVVPVHQFVFQPGVQRVLGRLDELGPLVRCTFVAASAGVESTGIGADELVSEILPHPLSLFARLTPLDVGELDWRVVRPGAGELRALAVAGTTSLEIALTAHGRPPSTTLEVMGSRGTATADLFHGFATVDRGRAGRVTKLTGPFTRNARTLVGASVNLAARTLAWEPAYPGLRELVRRTYAAIASGEAPPISVAETVAVAVARDRILAG